MADQWYYSQQGQRCGPVTSDQLKQLATSGQLQPTDLVWKKGMAQWVKAEDIKGLMLATLETPPPIPVSPVNPVGNAPLDFLDAEESSPSAGMRPIEADNRNATSRNSIPGKSEKSTVSFDWNNWDIWGKTIFVSACIAAASMLMTWVDVGLASANGFSQCAFLFWGVFVFPLLMLLKKRPIHLVGGIVCGALGIVCSLGYIASKQVEIFGHSANFASGGAYVFLLCCVALIVGVVKHKPGV